MFSSSSSSFLFLENKDKSSKEDVFTMKMILCTQLLLHLLRKREVDHRVELVCGIVKCEAKPLLVFCSDLEFNGFECLYLNPVLLPEDPGMQFCLSKMMDSTYEKHNDTVLACVAQNSKQWFWSRKYQRNIA